MIDKSKSKHPLLRRSRAVPTLLTVPDLRGGSDATDSVADPQPADALVAENREPIAQTAATPGAAAAQPAEQPFEIPSMDDLLEAASVADGHAEASETAARLDEQVGGQPSPVRSKRKDKRENRWFTGNLKLDLTTLLTVAGTIAICALVARAMKPGPEPDVFGTISANSSANSYRQ